MLDSAFWYTFPALRGIQAGNEYYVSMCPLRLVPRIFSFDDEGLDAECRAQRVLNKSRIPMLASYITDNPDEYVFSALTASVDADVEFVPYSEEVMHYNIGALKIPMSARFVINDGQHRRAAIEVALKERPELSHETIAVVFFVDRGLARSQQMFADLNRYAIRPTQSLNILYDHRDPMSRMVRDLVHQVAVFQDMTETDKSTISNRSKKLFTLSGIHRATSELLRDYREHSVVEQERVAASFWNAVSEHVAEWRQAKAGEISSATLRKEYIHAHAITLAALGKAGRTLLSEYPSEWKQRLVQLERINWRRDNSDLWEGRVTIGGHISAAAANQTLLANAIKIALDLPLSEDERAAEFAHRSNELSSDERGRA